MSDIGITTPEVNISARTSVGWHFLRKMHIYAPESDRKSAQNSKKMTKMTKMTKMAVLGEF